jgi:hypothetical protein
VDPILASIAEFWWIGASAAGAGTIGWIGLRRQRSSGSRRLAVHAARHELREARDAVTGSRVAVRMARAELARAQAERAAAHATPADVSNARRRLQQAQREVRAAYAEVRLRRIQVSAARATMPRAKAGVEQLPLARLMAEHAGIDGRWLEYETDPAKRIAFPAMSDVRVPTTAAYLAARAEASRLRPPNATTRMTPVEFARYRGAVEELGRAFERAEREAWRQAGASGPGGPGPDLHWVEVAQSVAQTVITRSGEAIARAAETKTWVRAKTERTDASPPPDRESPRPENTRPETPRAEAAAPPPAGEPRKTQPVWPVPSRTPRPAGD